MFQLLFITSYGSYGGSKQSLAEGTRFEPLVVSPPDHSQTTFNLYNYIRALLLHLVFRKSCYHVQYVSINNYH